MKRLALLLVATTLLALPSWVHAQAQAQYETSFIPSPLDPLAGEEVAFRSLAAGGESWDLDGDGRCDDARGPVARRRFPRPGRYRVTLCISQGVFLTRSTQEILVTEPHLTFAVVRLQGHFSTTGGQIRQLRVWRSTGARIALRCRGRDCPYSRRSIPPGRRVVTFRGLQRRLQGNTRLSIYVTQPRRIGRYTTYRIRRGREPVRQDRCLRLSSLRFRQCPD